MKKRMILALMLIGLLAFGAGLGTYAWFTSQATSTDNVFQTGTLKMSATESAGGVISVTNQQPGDSKDYTVTIAHDSNSTLPFRYKLIPTVTADADLADDLVITIVKNENITIFNGTINLLDQVNGYEINENLAVDKSDVLTITLTLPTSAENDCQGKSAEIDFEFRATQLLNENYEGDY